MKIFIFILVTGLSFFAACDSPSVQPIDYRQYLDINENYRMNHPVPGVAYAYGSVKNIGTLPIKYWAIIAKFKNKKGEVIDSMMQNSTTLLLPTESQKFMAVSRDDGATEEMDFIVDKVEVQ